MSPTNESLLLGLPDELLLVLIETIVTCPQPMFHIKSGLNPYNPEEVSEQIAAHLALSSSCKRLHEIVVQYQPLIRCNKFTFPTLHHLDIFLRRSSMHQAHSLRQINLYLIDNNNYPPPLLSPCEADTLWTSPPFTLHSLFSQLDLSRLTITLDISQSRSLLAQTVKLGKPTEKNIIGLIATVDSGFCNLIQHMKGLKGLKLTYDDLYIGNILSTLEQEWSAAKEIDLMIQIASEEEKINKELYA